MEYLSGGDRLYANIVQPGSLGNGGKQAVSGFARTALPLVLLHPTPLDHRFWLPVLPCLSRHLCIVPDLRGHGRSPLGSAPFRRGELAELSEWSDGPVLRMEQLALDAVALLDALGLERAVFIGCSIGGYTLYQLWRTHPERISGLVFCASKPQADTGPERSKRAEWIAKHELARLAGEHSPTGEFVEAMLAALLSRETQDHRPELVAEVARLISQVSPESIQAIQRGLAERPDSQATAKTVTVPTCVLAGEQDTSSRPADMDALHELLKTGGAPSSYHLVGQAGHYFPMEQPAAVGAILADFCRTHLEVRRVDHCLGNVSNSSSEEAFSPVEADASQPA